MIAAFDLSKILKGYEGKWVALSPDEDGQLIVKGSGNSITEAIKEASKNGEDDPIIMPVPLKAMNYVL